MISQSFSNYQNFLFHFSSKNYQDHFEIEILILVQPGEGQPGQVGVEDSTDSSLPGETVRAGLAEDVTDPAAGRDLHPPPALPDSEGHLEVLPAPDVHLLVVGAGGPEVVAVDAEEAASHDWSPVRLCSIVSHLTTCED